MPVISVSIDDAWHAVALCNDATDDAHRCAAGEDPRDGSGVRNPMRVRDDAGRYPCYPCSSRSRTSLRSSLAAGEWEEKGDGCARSPAIADCQLTRADAIFTGAVHIRIVRGVVLLGRMQPSATVRMVVLQKIEDTQTVVDSTIRALPLRKRSERLKAGSTD
jgi:hypothetical protein